MSRLLYIILLLSLTVSAQTRQALRGKVVSGGVPVTGIFVINKTTGVEIKTDANGIFSLDARNGDRLVAYSNTTEVREFAVTALALATNPYIMEVESKATELKEVVITDVNSEKLGLVPKGQKQYTPAERKLNTASSAKMNPMGLDPLINAISGRTKMLERALDTEHKEILAQKINDLFTNDDLKAFGLPEETARGFIFYIVEDARVADAIKGNNPSLLKLILMELSQTYLKLQKK
jgi:hypothetical protein